VTIAVKLDGMTQDLHNSRGSLNRRSALRFSAPDRGQESTGIHSASRRGAELIRIVSARLHLVLRSTEKLAAKPQAKTP